MSATEKNCKFSNGETLIAYLYNEMAAGERLSFEEHLGDCSVCIDELAEVSLPRYSVYEWHKVDFAPLETPRFEVPYETTAGSTVSGWIRGLVDAIAFRPALSFGGAFAAVLFIAAMVYVGISLGPADVAGLDESVGNPTPVVSPSNVVLAEQRTVNEESREEESNPSGPNVDDPSPKVERERSIDQPLRVADRVEPRRNRDVKGNNTTSPRTTTPVAVPVNATQTAPRLNEFDDLADESIRLADLFEDIETSD